MPAPILFIGDLHLGRSPHRLAAAGLGAARLGPAEAWRRVVRVAQERDVQAVVLAGDVVDQDKDRFEALGHLARGAEQLLSAGIRVLGVAGNHDAIALPRLDQRIEGFKLLGAGGTWERVELDGVDLLGWSFPGAHHRQDPLDSPGLHQAIEGRRGTLLGVLHADLDAAGSPYAPVRRADLAALAVDGWFLGHIHQASLRGARPLGYLGSLVGLDRSETGRHGPWLVTPQADAAPTTEQLALGPVHWVEVDVDLSSLVAGEDAQDCVHTAIEERLSRLEADDPWLHDGDFAAVGCSVRFTGRTAARAAVRAFMRDRTPQELVFELHDRPYAVVHQHDTTRPALDLGALATERTPLGQIARLLLALEEQGSDALPAPVDAALRGFSPTPWTDDLERHALPDPLQVARAAALDLLEQLLAQDAGRGAR